MLMQAQVWTVAKTFSSCTARDPPLTVPTDGQLHSRAANSGHDTTPQLLAVIATNPGSRARHVLNGRRVDAADAMSRARRSSAFSGWGWSQAS